MKTDTPQDQRPIIRKNSIKNNYATKTNGKMRRLNTYEFEHFEGVCMSFVFQRKGIE